MGSRMGVIRAGAFLRIRAVTKFIRGWDHHPPTRTCVDGGALPLRLVRCRGNLNFGERLVRGLVSLGLAAELRKLVRHRVGLGDRSQHPERRVAAFEFLADALAVACLE